MKKKILSLFLCFCLVLPCMMFLSACGKKKDVNINIFHYTQGLSSGVQEILLIDSTSFNSSNWKDYNSIGNNKIGKEVTKFSAKEDSEIQIFIVLEPGYDINDVKVKPNGATSEALSPSKSFKDTDSESWVFAYTVAEKLKDELWIMFEGEPVLRTQTVTLAQTNAEFFSKVAEEWGECDPASVFLADATFTLTYKIGNGVNHTIFEDLSLNDFKSKLESNFSFDIPASATLSLKVTTGVAAYYNERLPQALDLSSGGISGVDNTKHTFTSDRSSTLSTQIFSNKTMNIDWKQIRSNNLSTGVSVIVSASFKNNIDVKDITSLNGTSLWANDTPFSFSEYNNYKNTGYYIKFDISKADYILLTDPATTITFGSDVHYTSAEAIELGVLKFNNTENPTEAWLNPKDIEITEYGFLWIHIYYNEENIAQNTNFHTLQLKVTTENNNTSPYKFAKFESYDPDLVFLQRSEVPEEYHNDLTYPIDYSCYYLKGSELTMNHFEAGYITNKDHYAGLETNTLGQTITIKFKTTNGIQTVTATFVKYDEYNHHWEFNGELPTWLSVSTEGEYYNQTFPFIVDTEELKTVTGGDLYEIEVIVPDHVAQD